MTQRKVSRKIERTFEKSELDKLERNNQQAITSLIKALPAVLTIMFYCQSDAAAQSSLRNVFSSVRQFINGEKDDDATR